MTHLDPETLALAALGELAALTAADRRHLAGCAECRAELEALARPVLAARSSADALETPDPRVWEAIAAAVDRPTESDRPLRRPPARVRRRRLLLALAAVAVVLVGGVAAGVALLRPQPQQLASAVLSPFPDWKGSRGTAVLELLPDGRRVVDVQTDVPPDGKTDHEVWLMTPGAKRLVSLGLLHGTSGTFSVPAGIDVDRFRLVDVSDEPRDGNPAHSGNSIVRGALHS